MTSDNSNQVNSSTLAKKRKFRFLDYFFYYYDLLIKILSESARDVFYFFQRIFSVSFFEVISFVAIFFTNPLQKGKLSARSVIFGIPRILIGLVLLFFLTLTSTVGILLGGTLSGLLGFRNIYDYSLKEQIVVWLPLFVFIVAFPFIANEFWLFKVCLVLSYSVVLVGFDFLYGQCGIISIGHAGFVMLGSFFTAFFYQGAFGFKLPYLISMLASAMISFVFGILLGLPSLRIKDYYLVIITISFTLSIQQIMSSQIMAPYSGLSMGGISISQPPIPEIFSWMRAPIYNYFFLTAISLVLIIFAYNIRYRSQIGRAFQVLKCDVEIPTIFGVPAVRYKLLAFAMSAFYASVGGSLIMLLNRFISHDSYSTSDSIDILVASVISGPGSLLGNVVGGAFLTFQRDISAAMASLIFRGNFLTRLFYGVFMIFVVFVAPQGIVVTLVTKLKLALLRKPKRGIYYINPSPDYDFLDAKVKPIKKE